MIDFRSARETSAAPRSTIIQIRIAAPRGDPRPPGPQGARAAGDAGPAHLVVVGRGHQARDDQLPLVQAGEGRPLLRAHLRSGEGLGVPLRQVQAHPLPRRDLRPLRRGSDAEPRCAASAWGTSSSPCRWRTSGSSRRCRARWATCSTSRSVTSRRSSTTRTTSSSSRGAGSARRTSCSTRRSTSPSARRRRSEGDTAFQRRHRRAGGARAAQAARRRQRRRGAARVACPTRASQHRKKQMLKRLKIVDAFRNSGDAGGVREQARSG